MINLYQAQSVFTHAWASFNWNLPAATYGNIVYDVHVYTCFHFASWIPLWFETSCLVDLFYSVVSINFRPSVVGEWSNCVSGWYGKGREEFRDMSSQEKH